MELEEPVSDHVAVDPAAAETGAVMARCGSGGMYRVMTSDRRLNSYFLPTIHWWMV
jgi:hypothetical protein